MQKLIKSVTRVAEYMDDRGLGPKFSLLIDDGGVREEIALETTTVLPDPCTGLLYLAYQIRFLEQRTLTKLHQSFAIEADIDSLFQCRFTIKHPDQFSNVVFSHYALYILLSAARHNHRIILNHYIPEVANS